MKFEYIMLRKLVVLGVVKLEVLIVVVEVVLRFSIVSNI